jgi:hypothetical protein
MSFTTSNERKVVNKTENINEYMKNYRAERKTHYQNIDKCKYYLKKGLTQELIDNYGELSGSVFKFKNLYNELINQNPDIKEKLLNELK